MTPFSTADSLEVVARIPISNSYLSNSSSCFLLTALSGGIRLRRWASCRKDFPKVSIMYPTSWNPDLSVSLASLTPHIELLSPKPISRPQCIQETDVLTIYGSLLVFVSCTAVSQHSLDALGRFYML